MCLVSEGCVSSAIISDNLCLFNVWKCPAEGVTCDTINLWNEVRPWHPELPPPSVANVNSHLIDISLLWLHSSRSPRCPRIYHLIVSAHHWTVSALHARSDSIIIFFYSITTFAQWAALWPGIRAIYVIDIIRYWFHTTFNVKSSTQ